MTGDSPGLVQRLLTLLAMPCVTGEEGPIADWLVAHYRGSEAVARIGHSVVVGEADPSRPTVLLVGHLDVVPPTVADARPRVDDDRVVGRGSSDMKSGLAVAMDCFEDAGLRAGPYNLVLVAYAGEEGGHDDNELGAVLAESPLTNDADLAVVLEPTDLAAQLGCLGALQAEIAFSGRAAHAARPWQGVNALHVGGLLLADLHGRAPEPVTVDGLVYREVFTATQAWVGADPDAGRSGNARNVVPDRFTVNVNYRFAPDKTLTQAEARVADLAGPDAEVVVTDRAPAAPPDRDAPLVRAFIEAVGAPVEPKQAWTDVARLRAAGIPALNYGPGLTAQAHQAGEHVPTANLGTARRALARFLSRT